MGEIKPNINATNIVIYLWEDSVSKLKANNVKIIIVNEGGTNTVDIIRASLSLLFCKGLWKV